MRYYYHSKATADASCKLRMSDLRKRGMLLSGETTGKMSWTSSMRGTSTTLLLLVDVADEPFALLMYSVTDREGNKTDYNDKVSLVTTPCNYGGERYWFSCPDCWSPVAVLYLAPGDVRFRCRHCNNLSYNSRNRCMIGEFGHTSRQIDALRSEIKRWTWRGRPTRKVRRLHALERKMRALSGPVMARTEKRIRRMRR